MIVKKRLKQPTRGFLQFAFKIRTVAFTRRKQFVFVYFPEMRVVGDLGWTCDCLSGSFQCTYGATEQPLPHAYLHIKKSKTLSFANQFHIHVSHERHRHAYDRFIFMELYALYADVILRHDVS